MTLDLMVLPAEGLPRIQGFTEEYPWKPFYYLPGVPPAGLARFQERQLAASLSTDGALAVAATQGSRAVGLAICTPSPWESRALGVSAGSLTVMAIEEARSDGYPIHRGLTEWAVQTLQAQGVNYITGRVDANAVGAIRELERSRFINLDTIVHLHRAPGPAGPGVQAVTCRPHREEDLPALRAIARRAYTTDRFHADPLIPAAVADEVYASWIENCCHGLDDVVLVAELDGRPVGFMTVRLVTDSDALLGALVAKIWLVGVAESHRGRGVGRALVHSALDWCRTREARHVEVGTQLRNIAALRLYLQSGFLPVNAVHAFRL